MAIRFAMRSAMRFAKLDTMRFAMRSDATMRSQQGHNEVQYTLIVTAMRPQRGQQNLIVSKQLVQAIVLIIIRSQ